MWSEKLLGLKQKMQNRGWLWGEGLATLAEGHASMSNQELQLCPVQS